MEQGQQRLRITLARPDSGVSWGFRLQGGADFTTPLSIQLVNPGSIAERYGLHPGDAVLQINGENADYMEHEQAKRHIVAGGNNVEFIVERGGVRIWKPKVTPMSELRPGELQTHGLPNEPAPVQRTSLAHHELQGPSNIGVAHNRSARPFGGSNLNQPPAGYKPGVVHSQFNTPIGLYSADNIADTFVSQTSAMSELDINDDTDGSFPPPPPPIAAPDTSLQSSATWRPPSQTPNAPPAQMYQPPPPQKQYAGAPPAPPPAPLAPIGSRAPPAPLAPNGSRAPPAPLAPNYSRAPPAPLAPNGSRAPPAPLAPNGSRAPPAPLAPNGSTVPPAPKYTPSTAQPVQVAGIAPRQPEHVNGNGKGEENGNLNLPADAPPEISPTLLALQEELKAQQRGEQEVFKGLGVSNTENHQSRSFRLLKEDLDSGGTGQTVPGMRSVRAPQTRAPSAATQQTGDVCPMCGMLVTGVFVKVRGKSLHADCFRCEECRKSLKNQGYFWINDRMYCEEHAKQLTQPPDPDLVAVPIYR